MQKQEFDINGLKCLCCKAKECDRITYILYPMDILGHWIGPATQYFGTSIVVITGMDWDNALTPWPAKGVPKGCPDFKGHAAEFLKFLGEVVRDIEGKLGLADMHMQRSLVGVSLSGLFTLWQWPQSNLFRNIASLSGSLWYEGFMDWFQEQSFDGKSGMAYFLLGDKESTTSVKAFKSVGCNTEKIVSALKSDGITTIYETVPGNHYEQPIERLNRAMSSLHKSE
ncbi:MAG: hypothetical protein NC043_03190 [Muribaculaceae bacterium]|nr:hypothetical protein [Muribaculaceae bacterium]